MSKTKITDKSSKKDKKAELSSVKAGRVTKPAQTPKAKSKDIAKSVASGVKDKKKKTTKKAPTPEPESDSESESSESEEESDDDSSESSSDEEVEEKKTPAKAAPKVAAKADSDSDSSDSSEAESDDSDSDSSEDEKPAAKAKTNGVTKVTAATAEAESTSDSSDGDSDSSESEDEKPAAKTVLQISQSFVDNLTNEYRPLPTLTPPKTLTPIPTPSHLIVMRRRLLPRSARLRRLLSPPSRRPRLRRPLPLARVSRTSSLVT